MSKEEKRFNKMLQNQNERLMDLLALHAGGGARKEVDPSFLSQALSLMKQKGATKKRKKLTKKQLQALSMGRAKLRQMKG